MHVRPPPSGVAQRTQQTRHDTQRICYLDGTRSHLLKLHKMLANAPPAIVRLERATACSVWNCHRSM